MMKTLAFVVAFWLMSSLASAQLCAEVTSDYNALSEPQKTNVLDYYNKLVEIPAIADSMGYCTEFTAHPDMQQGIWDKFEEAALNVDGVQSVAAPADLSPDRWTFMVPDSSMDDNVGYTKAEAINTYAAKVAHALWLDINLVVPWRLIDIPTQHLDGLFRPYLPDVQFVLGHTLFQRWDLDGLPAPFIGFVAVHTNVVDHSPKDTLALLRTHFPDPFTGSERAAMAIISDEFANDRFLHIGAGEASWGLTVTEHFDPRNERTPCSLNKLNCFISRRGCHSMSRFMLALSRSINIPGYVWAQLAQGGTHEMAGWPTAGVAQYHGDDPYGSHLEGARGLSRFFDYACWDAIRIYRDANCVGPTGCPVAVQEVIAENTLRHYGFTQMQWTSRSARLNFCNLGWQFIVDALNVGGFVDWSCEGPRLTDYFDKLVAETGCTGDPP